MTMTQTAKRSISRGDIMPMDQYRSYRQAKRDARLAAKRDRVVDVGPFATFYFESYATMWWQIHEMLHIERGGEEQIADEISAYDPLVPKGNELVATLMFQIEDEDRRRRVLAQLGGIEDTAFLRIGGDKVVAEPEQDVERTNAAGKTSSVHFLHFRLSPAQAAAFADPAVEVSLGFGHPHYAHTAQLSAATRKALAADL